MVKNKLTLGQEQKYADTLSQEMRDKIVKDLLSFVDTDVVLFRVEYPQNLRARQDEKWGEVLNWFKHVYGIMPKITSQILPVEQDEKMVKVFQAAVAKMDGRELIAFAKTAGVFTSLILALAVMNKHLTVEDAFALSRMEELFQNEMWGEDKEAVLIRNAALEEAKNAMRIVNG